MRLPFLDKKPKKTYYLALLLRDEKIAAVIFAEHNGAIHIIGKHEEPVKFSLETVENDELIELIDKTLSTAEEKLPAEITVHNTIFGVKDTWVEGKKIKRSYLTILKQVCEKLDLVPIGFIVLSEAIAHLIQEEEGAPVSALITEVGKESVTISLFRAGKFIETKHKKITTSPMQAVDDALKEFERVEIFPSRVILFHSLQTSDPNEHDELTQQFIAHPWSKGLPFLHLPQVSILPTGFDNKAIVAGAATQLGFSFTGIQETKTPDIQNYHQVKTDSKLEENPSKEFEDKTTEKNDKEHVDSDNFGFVLDQDITTLPQKHHQEPEESDEDKVTFHQSTSKIDEELDSEEKPTEQTENITEPVEHVKQVKHHNKRKLPSLSFLLLLLKPLRKLKFPRLPLRNRFVLLLPILLILILLVLGLYLFKLKATVTLFTQQKTIDETEKLTFSTVSNNDFKQNIINAKELSVALDGSGSTDATGKKDVGEKAKGAITLYNSDTSSKTLKAGTIVTSDNNLNYLLDKDVSIASASGDIFSGTKSGTAQVSVTAAKIGTEYNLPSKTKFSVEGSNVIAAKNDEAFSGGSKKSVTVVTKKDLDKLTEDVPKSLEQKAKEQLQEKAGNDYVILPEITKTDLNKKTFDKKIDEEAKSVKLTANVTFYTLAYKKADTQQFAVSLFSQKHGEEQILQEDNIDIKISGLKQKSDTEMSGVADMKAGLLPKIDTKKIATEIAGKSFVQAIEYGKKLPQVTNVEISLKPNIPFLPRMLPRFSNNITIVTKN